MSDRLVVLIKRIHETRPVQTARRQALLEELRELRRDFDEAAAPDQAHRLDAAILLMEFMSRAEDVATSDTLRIVGELVSTIDPQRVRAPRPRTTPAQTATASPAVRPDVPTALAGKDVAEHRDLSLTQDYMLGSILLQANLISADSLSRALQLHTSSGMALGQCLIQLGAASPEQIAAAVQYQDRLREELRATRQAPPKTAAAAPTAAAERVELKMSSQQHGFVKSLHAQLLGEVMIRLGTITREQLEKALRFQRASNLHIGEAIVQTGATTWEQIKRALEVQRQLRRSVA